MDILGREDAIVEKRGENVIWVSLTRKKNPLLVSVKIHPRVEELVRGWGTGLDEPVQGGRWWKPTQGGPPLRVWNLDLARDRIFDSGGGSRYRINAAGRPLIFSDGDDERADARREQMLNLSFIRLVGASGPDGVSFEIAEGVHSLPELRKLADQIKVAGRRFYIDFLMPVDLTVVVSTQETKL